MWDFIATGHSEVLFRTDSYEIGTDKLIKLQFMLTLLVDSDKRHDSTAECVGSPFLVTLLELITVFFSSLFTTKTSWAFLWVLWFIHSSFYIKFSAKKYFFEITIVYRGF